MKESSSSGAARALWIVTAILAFLHWDFWYWSDRTLLFGFLPIGLAYQAAYSIAASILWACAVRFAWPADLEEWAQGDPGAGAERAT